MTALPPAPDGGANPGTGPLALGSLCTGYAGLDMAVSAVLDVRPAWVADPDPGAAAILAHHYPDVPNLGDITTTDWTAVPPVDVVAAGYPCQPFSRAGLQRGTSDERHLWPHISAGIRHLRPRLVVLENVTDHLRLGFGAVLADLAALGFDAEWATVRAAEIGAPHERDRLFVVAWPADPAGPRLQGARLPRRAPRRDRGSAGAAPHSADVRHQRPGEARNGWSGPSDGDISASRVAWGKYEPAVRQWARLLRPTPPARLPTGRGGAEQMTPALAEWLMGLSAGHVTAVPGLTRRQMIHALGNGVVWQQGAAALGLLLDRIGAAA